MRNGVMADYTELNTIPAIMGILFATASGVMFLDATVTLGVIDYTFSASHSLLVGMFAMIVAFASSETNDWRHYESYEQGIVVVATVLMVGSEYVVEISDMIANNSPVAGVIAFAVSVAAWGVLAR